MDRVEEIRAAIEDLPPDYYRRIAQRFREVDQTRWDKHVDLDSSSGKLDFLFTKTESESTITPELASTLRAQRP
jgi:hypothetical protein